MEMILKNNIFKRCVLCSVLFAFLVLGDISAQTSVNMKNKQSEDTDSVIPFKERIAIRTNAVDWIALLPNFGIECDLLGKPHNISLNLNVKANFTTFHSSPVKWIYDITDIRLELRRYIRTSFAQGETKTGKDRFQNFLKWQSKSPRTWRAYYIGGYVNAGGYNLKFNDIGRVGKYIGGGMTFGYMVPLYQYRKGSIDFELGGSAGFVYTQLDTYDMVTDNSYNYVTKGIKKFIPYPIITDFKVGFVYRFNNLQDKYKESRSVYENLANKINQKRLERATLKQQREAREKFVRDSLYNEKLEEENRLKYGGIMSDAGNATDSIMTSADSIAVTVAPVADDESSDKVKSDRKKRKAGKRKSKDVQQQSSSSEVMNDASVGGFDEHDDESANSKKSKRREKKNREENAILPDEEQN